MKTRREYAERLPDDWVEERNGALGRANRPAQYRPRKLTVNTQGDEDAGGLRCHFVPAPFRFCLHCRVSYGMTQSGPTSVRWRELSSEGRSTATTILTMSAITALRKEGTLKPHARKLLSFTDNRQDASLAGRPLQRLRRDRPAPLRPLPGGAERWRDRHPPRGPDAEGLRGAEPAQGHVRRKTRRPSSRQEINLKRAFREVIGYRLYRDLKRGWRVTSPNLEQCGLLEIRYPVLRRALPGQG